MFDSRRRTKIKNNKVQHGVWNWLLLLMSKNIVQDSKTLDLTRLQTLYVLQIQTVLAAFKICHPRMTRMLHFVKTKNLPFSTTDVKRVVASCKICAEVKPVFFRQESGVLIKSTQSLERLRKY